MASLYAATVRMAEYDDMGDLQVANRVFNRRRSPVVIAVIGERRDEVGDIAVDKKLTLIRAKDGRDVNAAITARDNHGAGALALVGEAAIPCAVLVIGRCLPTMITLHHIGRKRFRVLH